MYVILTSVYHGNGEGSDAIFSSKVLIYSKQVASESVDFDDFREVFRSFGGTDFCWKTDLHEIKVTNKLLTGIWFKPASRTSRRANT